MLRNKKYLYGEKNIDIPANVHFGDFMLGVFWKNRDKFALINGATHDLTTYGRLAQDATNLAVSLIHLGVRKGDVVGIMSENTPECLSIFVAVACVGAVVTPINHLYTERETTHILSISKPAYIFCSSVVYTKREHLLQSNEFVKKIIIIDKPNYSGTLWYKNLVTPNNSSKTSTDSSFTASESCVNSSESSVNSSESNGNGSESSLFNADGSLKRNVSFEELQVVKVKGQTDTLVIFYSSGTTGLPKGVMLTHLNLILMSKCKGVELTIDPNENKPIMNIGPWFHVMGLIATFIGLWEGRTVAFLPKFNLTNLLKTVEKFKVVAMIIAPAVIVSILKETIEYDFSSVKYIIAGSAPIHKDTVAEFLQKFPHVVGITTGYGMTECTMLVVKNLFSKGTAHLTGSVGKVMDNAVIKFVDVDTREPVGANQKGELCVKGEIFMKGYIGIDLKEILDDEGFFMTGDVGYYDEEGYIFIVDRLKELIKYKGNQVAPAELEALLLVHEAVKEAVVVGLVDKEAGELPLAFVQLQPGKAATEEELQKFVAERISNPKHLRGGVRFIDEIPKNATGKKLRHVLRKMVNES